MTQPNLFTTVWRRYLSNWHFHAGLLLALGTTSLAPAIDYGLFALQAHRKVRLFKPALILAGLILISVFHVTDWIAPITWGFRIVLLASLIHHVRINRSFVAGTVAVLIVQIGFGLWQLHDGINRPWGITPNASSLGLAGMVFMELAPLSGFLGAIVLGISGSRTYLFTAAILAIMSRDHLKIALFLLAATIALAVVIQTGQTHRFKFRSDMVTVNGVEVERQSYGQSITKSADIRKNLLQPSTAPEIIPPSNPASVELTLWQHLKSRPLGMGYRDYNHETGRLNPHNQFVLMLWELGWLAIPFLMVVSCMIRQSGLPWRYKLALIPGLLLTDEFFARPEGLYALAVVVIGARYHVDVWRERVYSEHIGKTSQ